jgi:hypothetical protein
MFDTEVEALALTLPRKQVTVPKVWIAAKSDHSTSIAVRGITRSELIGWWGTTIFTTGYKLLAANKQHTTN